MAPIRYHTKTSIGGNPMRTGNRILQVALLVCSVSTMAFASLPPRVAELEQINEMIRQGNWRPVMAQIRQNPILAQYKDGMGDTPLHTAASQGYVQMGRWLISKGAKINSTNYSGQTPLHVASDAGRAEMCQMLIRHGASVKMRDIDGLTPLHLANQAKCVSVLTSAGASVEAKDKTKLTPLFYAVASDRTDVVKAFIKAKANIQSRDRIGQTTLDWAHDLDRPQVASLLQSAAKSFTTIHP